MLLKNDNGTLPINKASTRSPSSVALADNKAEMNGNWNGDCETRRSDHRRRSAPDKSFHGRRSDSKRAAIRSAKPTPDFAKAVDAAKDSDFTILVVGESSDMSGEAASRSNIDLPGRQLDLVKAIHATGKPYAVVLINGRPLTINWLAENSPAILEAWFPGTMAGPAIVDTLVRRCESRRKTSDHVSAISRADPDFTTIIRTPAVRSRRTKKYTSKYLDIPNTPLFPFGHGLSYTQFRLTDLLLDKDRISAGSGKFPSISRIPVGDPATRSSSFISTTSRRR